MEKLLISIIILSVTCRLNVYAQTNLQAGAVGSFSKTNAWGAEAIYNIKVAKKFSIGPGVKVIKFTAISDLYWPLFASFKYYVPLNNRASLFINVDPGYSIYSRKAYNGSYLDENSHGGFYGGGGLGLMLHSKPAPYLTCQFTKYGYLDNGSGIHNFFRSINTLTFTAGVFIRNK